MSEPETNFDILLSDLDDEGILYLTLNDRNRRNALSEAMLVALHNALEKSSNDESIRVIILRANGPAFSAGHDLKEMDAARIDLDHGRAYYSKIMTMCSTVMQAIVACPKPVIAEVSGIATAAGCQLVASCDLAIASDTAKFSTPGVNIGLFCSTPMVALSRNLTNKHAMEMLLTGDMVSAERAAEMGLINRVVAEDFLAKETKRLASKLASKSKATLAIGKNAFYIQREMNLSSAYDYASKVMVDNMMIEDASEGVSAFLEKRSANWQDK